MHSQYRLAKFLEKNSDIPVVVEGDVCPAIKSHVFFEGMPAAFAELSYMQKFALYELGGASTLVCIEVLPKIYKTMDSKNLIGSSTLDNAMNPNYLYTSKLEEIKIKSSLLQLQLDSNKDINFDHREGYAVEYAEIAAKKHYSDTEDGSVFIVFGGGHDLKKEVNEYGFIHNEITFYTEEDVIEVSDERLIFLQQLVKYVEMLGDLGETDIGG